VPKLERENERQTCNTIASIQIQKRSVIVTNCLERSSSPHASKALDSPTLWLESEVNACGARQKQWTLVVQVASADAACALKRVADRRVHKVAHAGEEYTGDERLYHQEYEATGNREFLSDGTKLVLFDIEKAIEIFLRIF
jgi:hypothetical protein